MKCRICGAKDAEVDVDGVALCSACSEKVLLQKEYELRLGVVADYLEKKSFEEALGEIHVTERALGSRDRDGWVHRSLLSDRAMVLREAGRWEEALSMFDARLALAFQDPAEQASTALGAALALLRLGREAEANSRMDSVLDALERGHPQAVLPNLLLWGESGDVRMLEGRPGLIRLALSAYDLNPPPALGSDPRAVLAWAKTHWTH